MPPFDADAYAKNPCAFKFMGNCGPEGGLLHKIVPKTAPTEFENTVCDNHLQEFLKNGWVEEPMPVTPDIPSNSTDLLADSPVPTKYKSAWGDYKNTFEKYKTVAQHAASLAQATNWNTKLEPIDAPTESDEGEVEEGVVPAYKKFNSALEHKKARKLTCYCEAVKVKGNDGSLTHSGNVFSIQESPSVVCSNHLKTGMHVITTVKPPMKAKQIVDGTITKYANAVEHKKAEKLLCYCTEAMSKGIDGTKLHWGSTFQDDNGSYVCKNHLKTVGYAFEYTPGGGQVQGPFAKKCAACNSRKKLTHKMKRRGNPKVVGSSLLEICAECSVKYKDEVGWIVRPVDESFSVSDHKTQKAQGVAALCVEGFPVPSYDVYPANKELAEDILIGKFVRPCPMRPRHGFVESRVVKTAKQIEKLREETLAADPEAEFIVMPFIKADYSGIWTDGSLAIGEGHSGATEGTSAITLPVLGDFLATVGGHSKSVKKSAGIKDAPYVELLWRPIGKGTRETYTHETVQLRDGPKLPQGATDYIPAEIEVKDVLVAKGDLLRWEELMKATMPGTVVYHPNGSLASHYAIHAVLNNVPVMITREPRVGDKLMPTSEVINPVDLKDIKNGFTYALSSSMGFKDATYYMLAGLHHVVTWKGKYDRQLGAAMGCAFRLALIASAGECRHLGGAKAGRETVYTAKWKKCDGPEGRKVYNECLDKFLNHSWPSSGYGGVAWYSFAVLGAQMYNAIVDGEIDKAFMHFNNLVHSAHNGGWAFNKFMQTDEMTLAADHPVYAAIHAAPFIYDAHKTLGLLGQGELFAADYAWEKIGTFEETARGKKAKRNIVDKHGHVVEKGASKICEDCGNYMYDCTCNNEEVEHECKLTPDPDLQHTPAPPKVKLPVKDAQAYLRVHDHKKFENIHVQYKTDWYLEHGIKSGHDGAYGKKDYGVKDSPYFSKTVDKAAFLKGLKEADKGTSWAGSDTIYGKLTKKDDGWYMGDVKLLELEEK